MMEIQNKEEEGKKPMWHLVNFSSLKDFFTYGTNRTVTNLKIKRLADIKARETMMKKPEERDWGKIMIFLILGIIVFAVTFVIITQFMNYSETSTNLGTCKETLGICRGDLATCKTNLGNIQTPSETESHIVIPG